KTLHAATNPLLMLSAFTMVPADASLRMRRYSSTCACLPVTASSFAGAKSFASIDVRPAPSVDWQSRRLGVLPDGDLNFGQRNKANKRRLRCSNQPIGAALHSSSEVGISVLSSRRATNCKITSCDY